MSSGPPPDLPPPRPEDRVPSQPVVHDPPIFTYGKLALVAAMPVVAGLAIGLLAALLAVATIEEISGIAETLRGLLVVTSLGLGSSFHAGSGFGDIGTFTVLPLAVAATGAWLVHRFAAAPLRNPVVAAMGTAMTVLMWLLAAAILSIPRMELGFGETLRSSPSGASIIGGAVVCWGSAYILARFETARRFLLILIGWSGLAWLAMSVAIIRAEDVTFTESIMISYLAAMVSVNAAILSVYWVLLGKLGLTVDGVGGFLTELIEELGGDRVTVGFFEAAGEAGWLWLVGLGVVGGLVALGVITPQPSGRQEMIRRSGAMVGGIFALLWLGHLTGSPRLSGELFEIGATTATFGMITVPWGLVVPALLATSIWALTVWVVAYQRGAPWATMPDLNNPQATAVASTAAGRAFTGGMNRMLQALRELAQTPPPGSQPQQPQPPPPSTPTPPPTWAPPGETGHGPGAGSHEPPPPPPPPSGPPAEPTTRERRGDDD